MKKEDFLNNIKFKVTELEESASVGSVLGDPGSPTYGGFIGPLGRISKRKLNSRLFSTWGDSSVKNGSGKGRIVEPPQGHVKEHIYSVEGEMVTEGNLLEWFGGDLKQKPINLMRLHKLPIKNKMKFMKPNKIDNQIKDKLNAREIQPSAPAWDRLDAMLTVAEAKQPKRNFTWLYIAATFLLFSGLGFFLLNSNESVAIENVIPIVNNEITNEKIEENQLPKEIKFNTSEETVLDENNKLKNESIKINDENQVDLKNQVIIHHPSPITHHPSPNNYKYLSPEELLAQIEQPSKVDTNKIKINPATKIKVDANELLTKVEQEVHQKHKESTIDKLRRNFNEVKSAVANRNYE